MSFGNFELSEAHYDALYDVKQWAKQNIGLLLVVSPIVYTILLGLYRWLLHPLRNVPGPFLAGVTGWYEFYQDVILDGNYIHEYKGLHDKYGPVVRVTPDRVHIDDPSYYREVYVERPNAYKKDPSFYQAGGGIKHSIIMLIDPQRHKQRKEMIRPMFAPRFMEDIAPEVEGVIGRALEQAKLARDEGGPLDIQRIYQAITVDTIMRILFGSSLDLVDVALKPEKPAFLDTMDMFADSFLITKHFPFLAVIAVYLPFWLADRLIPGYARFRLQCRKWIEEIDVRNKKGIFTAESGRPTIFDLLLNPNEEKGHERLSKDILVDEAFALCFAGTDTTSYGLSLATFYILKHPEVLEKLRKELKTVPTNASGMLEYRDIVNLPYLGAVVKEALRCSTPVAGITPRIVPEGGAYVGDTFVPAGAIVSQTIHSVHRNETAWPQAEKFIPERWIDADQKEMDKFFCTFGKGPRSCIGSNITYLEMYLTLANFFNTLDMTLYKTDKVEFKDSAASRICKHVMVTINDDDVEKN